MARTEDPGFCLLGANMLLHHVTELKAQTKAAMAQADAVLFLVDSRAGAMAADRIFADLVRSGWRSDRTRPPVVAAGVSLPPTLCGGRLERALGCLCASCAPRALRSVCSALDDAVP